jgi:hypothetical protein
MSKNITNDALLEFFETIIASKEEFQVINLISKNLQEELIIETLINYKTDNDD